MRFSVVLPVCHGGSLLRDAVAAACALDWPPDDFEVWVAGGRDARAAVEEMSSTDRPVHYVVCISPVRAARLNAACAHAQGDVFVFLDDDARAAPDLLQRLAETLDGHPDAGIVGGVDALAPEAGLFDVALDCVLTSFVGSAGCRTDQGVSAGKYYPKLWNMAVVRAAAPEGGLFDETLPVHEDVDLADRIERAGSEIVFAPAMRVVHRRETTWASVLRRNFAMAGVCRAKGLHRGAHLVAAAGLLGVAVLAALSPWLPSVRLPFVLAFAVYGAVLAAAALAAAWRKRRPALLLVVPWLTASLHAARALGYLFARQARSAECPE